MFVFELEWATFFFKRGEARKIEEEENLFPAYSMCVWFEKRNTALRVVHIHLPTKKTEPFPLAAARNSSSTRNRKPGSYKRIWEYIYKMMHFSCRGNQFNPPEINRLECNSWFLYTLIQLYINFIRLL